MGYEKILTMALVIVSVIGFTPVIFSASQQTMAPAMFHSMPGASTNSLNWAGYAATGNAGSVTNVSASFVVPNVEPSSKTQYVAFWAGIDGFNDNTVEQAGVLAQTSGGSVSYSAWFEFYPASPVYASWHPAPGNVMTVYIQYHSINDTMSASVMDLNQSESFALRRPMCFWVALLYSVFLSSSSISLMRS